MICMNFHKIILWAQKFSDNSIQLTRLALCFLARVCQTVTDPDQAFGGGAWLSATIVGYHTKLVTFCSQESGDFCWSYYLIFHGLTGVKELYNTNSVNIWSRSQKMGASFPHKLKTLFVITAQSI